MEEEIVHLFAARPYRGVCRTTLEYTTPKRSAAEDARRENGARRLYFICNLRRASG
jgi:hypothetical protein